MSRPGARLLQQVVGFLVGIAVPAVATSGVFHSPNDDGLPGAPGQLLAPGVHVLHLYLEGGTSPSTADPCNQGNGSELCGWQVEIGATGGLVFDGFTPAAGVADALTADRLRAVGGDAVAGQLGPVKIGDLAVQANASGIATLDAGKTLDNEFALQSFERKTLVVAVPEANGAAAACVAFTAILALRRRRRWIGALMLPLLLARPASADVDADGIEDAQDVCPTRYDPGQEDAGGLDTESPDGIGDACQCGDVDDDGIANLIDVALLQRSVGALESLAAPAKCPGSACGGESVAALRQAIADEVPPASCAAATELACHDLYEPNPGRVSSRFLGGFDDSSVDGPLTASLPPADEDWFSFHVDDTFASLMDPRVELASGSDADLCAYFACDNAEAADFDCLDGVASSSPDGLPGCCSATVGSGVEQISAEPRCGSVFSDDSLTVFVRVRRGTAAPAACAPYTLQWGG